MPRLDMMTVRTVQLREAGQTSLAPNPEDHGLPWSDMCTDDEADPDAEILCFSDMTVESQDAIIRTLSNAHCERQRLAKKSKQRESAGDQLSPRVSFVLRLTEFVKRIILATFCATANLCSNQYHGSDWPMG